MHRKSEKSERHKRVFFFTKGKTKTFCVVFLFFVCCCSVLRCFLGRVGQQNKWQQEGGKGKKEYVNYIVKVYNRRTQKQRADRRTHIHVNTHTQKVVVLLLKVFNLLA